MVCGRYMLLQLKVIQAAFTLIAFAGFTVWYLLEKLTVNRLWAVCCLVGGVFSLSGDDVITYEVTVGMEARLAEAFEQYMRGKHIPAIMATTCFVAARFEKAAPMRYRTRFEAANRADLDFYLAKHAPRFREDFAAHFPSGCTVSREVWGDVELFSRER